MKNRHLLVDEDTSLRAAGVTQGSTGTAWACCAAAFHPPCHCAWLWRPQLANSKVQSCQRSPWRLLFRGLAAAQAGAVHAHPGVRCGRCAHRYFEESSQAALTR